MRGCSEQGSHAGPEEWGGLEQSLASFSMLVIFELAQVARVTAISRNCWFCQQLDPKEKKENFKKINKINPCLFQSRHRAKSRHVPESGTSVPGAFVLRGMGSKSSKPSREDLSQLNQSGW